MKKILGLIAVLVICLGLFSLSPLSHKIKIIGTWQGDGSLDILGMEAPYEFADQRTFQADGSSVVTVGENKVHFQYSMTDDTITLKTPELSWGIGYRINGSTLRIKTGDGYAEFVKVK